MKYLLSLLFTIGVISANAQMYNYRLTYDSVSITLTDSGKHVIQTYAKNQTFVSKNQKSVYLFTNAGQLINRWDSAVNLIYLTPTGRVLAGYDSLYLHIYSNNSAFSCPSVNACIDSSLYATHSYVHNNQFWTKTGNDLYNNNSGNLGIGTNSPSATLDVVGATTFSNTQGNAIYMNQTVDGVPYLFAAVSPNFNTYFLMDTISHMNFGAGQSSFQTLGALGDTFTIQTPHLRFDIENVSRGFVIQALNSHGDAVWKAITTSGNSGGEPNNPYLGQEYFNTTTSKFEKWNGTVWAILSSTP